MYVYILPYLDIVRQSEKLCFGQGECLQCAEGTCTIEAGKVEASDVWVQFPALNQQRNWQNCA